MKGGDADEVQVPEVRVRVEQRRGCAASVSSVQVLFVAGGSEEGERWEEGQVTQSRNSGERGWGE